MAEPGISSLLLGLKSSFFDLTIRGGFSDLTNGVNLFKEGLDDGKSRMIQYRVTEAQIDGETSEKKISYGWHHNRQTT